MITWWKQASYLSLALLSVDQTFFFFIENFMLVSTESHMHFILFFLSFYFFKFQIIPACFFHLFYFIFSPINQYLVSFNSIKQMSFLIICTNNLPKWFTEVNILTFLVHILNMNALVKSNFTLVNKLSKRN